MASHIVTFERIIDQLILYMYMFYYICSSMTKHLQNKMSIKIPNIILLIRTMYQCESFNNSKRYVIFFM